MLHIAKGLFYNSYRTPRVLLWSIGVIIFIVMMATAFLGYVLPYGQMSLWGVPLIAPNAYLIIFNFIFILKGCLVKIINNLTILNIMNNFIMFNIVIPSLPTISKYDILETQKIRVLAKDRIGPHDFKILSIIFGSLLGDCHAEFRSKGNGTRFCFYQESSHVAYLNWLHSVLANLGYCSSSLPEIKTRLGKKGIVRKVVRFKTWTYSSLNWIHDLWYINNKKVVPSNIDDYLNPLALAIWIMDDGSKVGVGLKLSTNCFTYSDCTLLIKVLYDNFNIKSTIQSTGKDYQYNLYIWKESMPLLREIVLPYVHPSMKYKLSI